MSKVERFTDFVPNNEQRHIGTSDKLRQNSSFIPKKDNCNSCNKLISKEESNKVRKRWEILFERMFKKKPTDENWIAYCKQDNESRERARV